MPRRSVDRAGDHDLAAVLARPGPDVDHPVGGPDGVLVVLDNDQRVAEIAQPGQRLDQPVVVPLVQPDRRLVQHVEHTDQAGPDLRGQPDPLRLTAGQGGGRPVQRQVVEADVEQEAQPRVAPPSAPARRSSGPVRTAPDPAKNVGRLLDRHRGQLGDVLPPEVGVFDRHRQDLRLEPGAVTGRAGHLPHVALVLLPREVGIGLRVRGARATG